MWGVHSGAPRIAQRCFCIAFWFVILERSEESIQSCAEASVNDKKKRRAPEHCT
jgi:hypothetical protein